MLKTFSLYKKLLTLFRAGHDQGEHRGTPGHRLLLAGPRAKWRLGRAWGLETGRVPAGCLVLRVVSHLSGGCGALLDRAWPKACCQASLGR